MAGWKMGRRWAAGLVLLATAVAGTTSAAPDGPVVHPELAGAYDYVSTVPNEGPATGDATLSVVEGAYELVRTPVDAPAGAQSVHGLGLELDHVLGLVAVPDASSDYPDSGLAIYRIAGGELAGFRLPMDGAGKPGREILKGSPDLSGRYEIALSEAPDGQPYYSGTVEIEHHGETYGLIWQTPDASYVGAGLRLGNILVVGYAREKAPVVYAYCIRGDWMVGIGGRGQRPTVSDQSLHRKASTSAPPPAGRPAACE